MGKARRPRPLARVNVAELVRAIEQRRKNAGLSLRGVAREAGLCASTLTRLRQGRRADLDAFVSLVTWIHGPILPYVDKAIPGPVTS